MSNPARTCPACGKPLPADAPQGLCPQCLAKSALGSQPGAEETLASGSKPGGSGPAAIQPEIVRLFPQLEILELLGQGGMGMVYKARQPQLDRLVALKVMRADLSRDPAFAERFAREARALAKLNHPNIVNVFDFGQTGGHCWFLMEFVDGRNLRELLRTKTLTPREALGIVPKVCDALQYAHDEGIVHRDIKPENILLDKKGRVKIADFGLAKLVGKEASDFSLTATGMTLGTPRYMAPEQFDKPQEVDHRADIYSLGVVLYEMLTGEVPMGRFAPPSATVGVDVRLDEVVLRSLEKEPSRRYQHASEVKTQVENISGLVANLPPMLRQAMGFEYKSKAELFGLPLVHIASGVDFQTGKARVARGIIAIGGIAKGVLAFGGAAYGGIAFGGFAVGVVTIAGCGIGLFSFAGLALALVAAYGGMAMAPVALGGFAVGYYACGGAAFGVHAVGGNANDPEARQLFTPLMAQWKYLNTTGLLLMVMSFIVPFGATLWARRQAGASPASPSAVSGQTEAIANPRRTGWRIPMLVGLVGLVVLVGALLWNGNPISRTLGMASHTTVEITKDISKLPTTSTPGRRDFAFTFTAPSNHVLHVWLEFWKDGKLEIPTAFSESYLPARGDSIRGGLHLITQDGDMAGVGSAGQMRFDWAMSRHARVVSDIAKLDSKATSASGQWRTNLFKERAGLASQLSWDDQSVPTVWRPKPGEVTTVLAWTGHAGKSVSSSDLKWSEESLPKGTPMVAILLRVRFDPVTPDQLSVAPMTKTAVINVKNRGPLPGQPTSAPR